MANGCDLINKICLCLTCGGGQYVVRFIHTVLCIAIPASLILNKHSDLYKWLILREGNYLFGLFYIGVLLASLIFYFCACLTDPGYVDQLVLSHLADDEEEEVELFSRDSKRHKYSPLHTSDPTNQEEHHIISNGDRAENLDRENCNTHSSTATTNAKVITDSGDGLSQDKKEDNSTIAAPERICKICKIPQPIRSRHCEDCKRCVLKYDHHCPWLSTCVGEKNHKFFWLFLLFINIVIVFSAVVAVRGFPSHKSTDKNIDGSEMAFVLFVILDCIILLVGGLSTISLFCFHSYLMCTNQTTWESVSRPRISYLKKLRDDYNPFDLGCCCNTYVFCCKHTPKHWRSVYKKSTSSAHLFEEV